MTASQQVVRALLNSQTPDPPLPRKAVPATKDLHDPRDPRHAREAQQGGDGHRLRPSSGARKNKHMLLLQ